MTLTRGKAFLHYMHRLANAHFMIAKTAIFGGNPSSLNMSLLSWLIIQGAKHTLNMFSA